MLPKDPNMLYSYMNMMLRDRYASLQEFCDENNEDPEEIISKLSDAGYEFIEEVNQFR